MCSLVSRAMLVLGAFAAAAIGLIVLPDAGFAAYPLTAPAPLLGLGLPAVLGVASALYVVRRNRRQR